MSLADNTQSFSEDQTLQKFGYQQENKRELKRFASFAVGFSFISITTGIFTTDGSVLNSSGPLGIWAWPLVIIGQLFVSLVFAALASRIPLAGYSYQWASRLANPKVGWLIGWISFIFLIVDVVAVDYAVASTVMPSLLNYAETPQNAWLVTAIVVLVQMVLIIFSTLWSARVNNTAVGTEVIGIVGLTLLLVIVGVIRGLLHPDHVFSTGTVSSSGWLTLGGLHAAGPFMLAFLLGAFTLPGWIIYHTLDLLSRDVRTWLDLLSLDAHDAPESAPDASSRGGAQHITDYGYRLTLLHNRLEETTKRTPPASYKPAPTCDRWRTYNLAMEMALYLYWKKWLRQHGRSPQPESIGHLRKEPIDESEDDLTCFNRSHQSLFSSDQIFPFSPSWSGYAGRVSE